MQEHIQSLKERTEAAIDQLANSTESADQFADSILEELRIALRESPGAGQLIGPLLKRLQAAQKARSATGPALWLPVGSGHLAIGHRPKIKAIPVLRQQGASHVLTLLSEAEGAADIGVAVKTAGIEWLWFPLESAVPPSEDRDAEVRVLYDGVRAALASGGKIYIHCSAGIHRTGMITYGLLRSMGSSAVKALTELHSLRAETGKGAGEDRLAWGNRFGVDSES